MEGNAWMVFVQLRYDLVPGWRWVIIVFMHFTPSYMQLTA